MSFKDHPALVAAALTAALIAARLLSIARFDVSTAATILQTSGTATAVAGTTLTLLPFALMVATCLLAIVVLIDPTLIAVSPGWSWTFFSLAMGATLCLTATTLVAATVAFVLVVAVIGRYLHRNSRTVNIADAVSSSRILRIQFTVLLVVAAMTPIILQRPWLPVQAIVTTDGSNRVGYVLGESQGALVVMSESDRSIEFLDPDRIRSRAICSGSPAVSGALRKAPQLEFRGSFLGALLWGRNTPHYPACPKSQ
ncbi:hypothetical protein [Kribbella soli]|uniref:Uncharacterized protein n=1 Tax=Kribbella soli TaxID=1124743 RepID=A0A4R0HNZ4_9ACTN|nr:hypothetical protein [Kribbella soli]TCC10972.1 hypothetical protein E0H45_06665 [Kribbella soli]